MTSCKEESGPTGTEQSDLTPGGPGHIHGSGTSCLMNPRLGGNYTQVLMTHQELYVSEKPGMVRVSQGTWQPTGSRETTGAPVPA